MTTKLHLRAGLDRIDRHGEHFVSAKLPDGELFAWHISSSISWAQSDIRRGVEREAVKRGGVEYELEWIGEHDGFVDERKAG